MTTSKEREMDAKKKNNFKQTRKCNQSENQLKEHYKGRKAQEEIQTRQQCGLRALPSPVARRHANAPSTKTVQIRMAQRHRGRNFATPSVTDKKQPLLRPAPQCCFPYYICTTNWPLPSPAPKSTIPYYIFTTNWPRLRSEAPSLQIERFVRDFLQKSRVKASKASVLREMSSKSKAPSLQNERFLQDFTSKSHASSLQNERFVAPKSPNQAFRTRLPPKVKRQVFKTSVSSKSHASKSPKRAFRTRLRAKVTHPSLQNERFVRVPPKVKRQSLKK